VRDLRRREAWGPGVEEVGFLETHVSWLFFVGERVYKVKRPVDPGSIDGQVFSDGGDAAVLDADVEMTVAIRLRVNDAAAFE
jgi:hypothetical protein